MKPPNADESPEPQKVLDLWMGGLRLDNGKRGKTGALGLVVAVAGSVIAVLLLAKYAADILFLLLPLAVGLLVLHAALQALMRSTLLSAGWLLAGLLLVGLFAWLVVPGNLLESEQWIPGPVVRVLERSQARGWGHTALTPNQATSQRPGSPSVDSGPGVGEMAPGGTAVTVPASQPSTTLGEPVTLTARFADEMPASTGQRRVRFFDGSTDFGSALVQTEWGVRVAHPTVTTRGAGEQQVLAGLLAGSDTAVIRSAPLRHIVVRTPGR